MTNIWFISELSIMEIIRLKWALSEIAYCPTIQVSRVNILAYLIEKRHRYLVIFTEPLYHTELNPTEPA